MKPKELRDRLFKDDRPNIRVIEVQNESGLGPDIGILWAAYKKGGFSDFPENLEQEQFAEAILNVLNEYHLGWIIEDSNKSFSSGYGATGVILATTDGWGIMPDYEPFPWTTKKNNVRSNVAFLQMMKYDKTIGIVNIEVNKPKDRDFLKKLKKYGVLNYTGTIPKGDFGNDKHIFYIRGNMKWVFSRK